MESELYEVEPNRNAEAYRNLQQVPGHLDKHLEFIEFCDEGYLLLGCSNLTGRYWSGSLWYFLEPNAAPDADKCLTGIELETGVCDGKFLHEKHKIIIGEDSGYIQVLELIEVVDKNSFHFTCLQSACEHDDSVASLSVFKDKSKAVSGSFDSSIKVWEIETLQSEHTYRPAHVHQVTNVNTHPKENCIFASSSLDGTALLWDTRNALPASVLLRNSSLTCITWQHSNTEIVVIGSTDGDIIKVDIRQPKEALQTVTGFSRPVHRIKFSPDRPHLLAACADNAVVKVFDSSNALKVLYSDERHNDFVRGIAWHPSNQNLYSCGWDKLVLAHTPNGIPLKMEVNGVNCKGDAKIET